MVNEQLQLAADWIRAGRYADARRLLQTINHPTAREWLLKLDAVEQSLCVRPSDLRQGREGALQGVEFRIVNPGLRGGVFELPPDLLARQCSNSRGETCTGRHEGYKPTCADSQRAIGWVVQA